MICAFSFSTFTQTPNTKAPSELRVDNDTTTTDTISIAKFPQLPSFYETDSLRTVLSDTTNPVINQDIQQSNILDNIDSTKETFKDTSFIVSDSLHLAPDSLSSLADTVTAIDTLALDSTARIEHLVHKRVDDPTVYMFSPYKYTFYLGVTSPAYKRELEIDSTGQFVNVREHVNGLDVKIPTTMPLEDYIKERIKYEQVVGWRSLASEYKIEEKADGLANLFGSLTNISIPIPSNPLMSIFGGTGINLRITGAVDIRGAYRRTSSDQVTISRFDQVRNEPDFNQDVQINVNGTVGDKLNILADWNTQRTFEYENQLKIKYTGYEDEIIQSIEAGNVSLQTPSFVGGGQALFGIKAKFQTGPLTLTALLSQKKGQTKELTVTGGAQQSDIPIQPYAYSTSHFFVDTLYRKFFEQLYSSTAPMISSEIQENRIIEIDVWISRTGGQPNPNERQVNAFIDLPGRSASDPPYTGYDTIPNPDDKINMSWRFIKLDQNQYKVNQYAGYITVNTNVSDDQAIAVAYRIEGPDPSRSDDDIFFGQSSVTDTSRDKPIILKLVKPRGLKSVDKPAWDLMLKNIYPIGGRDLKKEGFELKIFFTEPGQPEQEFLQQEPLLKVLGLDRFNQDNAPEPDGVFDFIPLLTVNVERAEIIFPTLRPFDSTIVRYFRSKNITIADSLLFSDVYDTTKTAAQNNTTRSNYSMKVKASTAQTSRYNLGFNIVEGSVSVLLNGQPLQPNVDYTVDYIVGEVVIRNPQALVPGANVQVKYEQNDLFQLASKTLIGARGELKLIPNTNLGFTIMNLNQATLSDKVRLGEEPTNNLIFGVDGSTSMNLPFLTDAIDALPLLRTKEMSTLRFGGEAAYMLPDANTKKSPISSDNSASIAYIDDFEGTRRTIPFSINYSGWQPSSLPVYPLLPQGVGDSAKTNSKAKLNWYNKLPSDVYVHEIWPNRSVRVGQDQVMVLNLDYYPTQRGAYNFSSNLNSTLRTNPEKNWAGIMRYISTTGGNIIEQNINYLEIWMKATSSDEEDLRKGKLYIDLGKISEDIIPNRVINSEDLVVNKIANGVLNPGEDIGFDMMTNAEEQINYTNFLAANAGDPDINPSDPSGDDWAFSVGGTDYSKINGSEKNELSVDGRFPNTEDMNGNGDVDLGNTYLEYEIPLDTVFIDSLGNHLRNDYIVGGGINKWYQFRIPLLQAARVIPLGTEQNEQSVLQNVQYIRMWVSGFKNPVSIRIADISLVGNQWQELIRNDSIFKVSVVNIEDNPEYKSPPGVIRERDRTQPDQVIEGNEQSLSLMINGLRRGESRQAVKYFPRPLDVFNYKSMKMFVHGDETFDYFSSDNYDAEIFIRFGADTLNFYEYRQPIRPGWHSENDILINFSELTSVKAARDSVNKIYRVSVRGRTDGATYGVRGNPSLTQIRYMGIGITHPAIKSRKSLPLYGQIWINELRVVEVDNSSGIAYRFDSQIKLADFGNVGFNYSRSDPNFHALDQRFGSRVTGINWAINTSFSLDKFFPQEWQGTSIPIGYSHSENLSEPKYLPNTDVLVKEAATRAAERASAAGNSAAARDNLITETQTLHVQDSYSVSNLRIGLPFTKWYVRDTFNKFTFGFNYSTSSDRNPSIKQKVAWQWNFRMNYGVNLPPDYFWQPFKEIFKGIFFFDEFKDWKLYYMPITNVSAGLNAQRSRNYEEARALATVPRETRNFGSTKSFGFGWKTTENGLLNIGGDYSVNVDRSLLHLDNDSVGRDFKTILNNIFFGGRDNRYGQRVSINSKPKIPNILGIQKYLDFSAGYSANYNWQNNFQQGDIGKSVAFDNNITLSTNFRLKSLSDNWFPTESEPEISKPESRGRQGVREDTSFNSRIQDTSKIDTSDTKKSKKSQNISMLLSQLTSLTKILIKIPLLDYENINISFSQTNRSQNSGVVGSTGFKNFWGRLPFQGSSIEYGPSRLYQLGLISDPSGTLHYSPKSSFPFVGWKTERGLRAKNASLADQYSQSNNITLRTNRPLWEGASLDINWRVGWQYNKNVSIRTDSLGNPTVGVTTTGGSVERSFLSVPPFLFLKFFKSGLQDVGKQYNKIKDTERPDVALAKSFEKGMETLPFLSKFLGPFVPRPNWTLRWDGVEKIGGINSWVERLSLEHGYASSFKRDFRGIPEGGDRTDIERVTNGFSPLVGLNMTFKELLKGNFTGNFRFNTSTNYDLNLSAGNITESFSQEISLSLTYGRRGFTFPLFGLNLTNDLDITFTYSRSKTSRRTHDPSVLESNQEGIPLEGNTRTTMEPRIRYVLSSRVTAALFYRYTKTEPDEEGSLIPGTTINEAGLDVHIAIQ